MTTKAVSALNRIDEFILERSKDEHHGLVNGLGGCSMYFLNRYFLTGNIRHHNTSIEYLETIIAHVNEMGFAPKANMSMPFFSPCWLIDQYARFGVVDASDKMNMDDVFNNEIISNFRDELAANRHDVFYGFIGTGLILIENDPHTNRGYIDEIVGALLKNARRNEDGIYWHTPDPFWASPNFELTINFSIPHGTCGIILFLLKCYDIYNLEALKPVLKGSIDWLMSRLALEENKLPYQYSSKPSATGKLGWCYGDQPVALTLLRYSETFECPTARAKAYELIDQAASKKIENTGVLFYPDYGYYDVRLCHGTASVAYMWQKMYQITGDERLKKLANEWLDITLDNLDIFLPQLDKIARIEKDNENIDTSMGFLNGLAGVGLAIMAFLDPRLSSWDKLLLLDRTGKDAVLDPMHQQEFKYAES